MALDLTRPDTPASSTSVVSSQQNGEKSAIYPKVLMQSLAFQTLHL